MSIADTKKNHQCGETKCKVCNVYENDKGNHVCKLRKTKMEKHPPALGFFKLQIVDENNADCYECFLKKSQLRHKFGLTWDELLTRVQSDTELRRESVCLIHDLKAIETIERYANLATLKVEKEKRGCFEKHVFADSDLFQLKDIPVQETHFFYSKVEISKKPILQCYGKQYKGTDLQIDSLEIMKKKKKKLLLKNS